MVLCSCRPFFFIATTKLLATPDILYDFFRVANGVDKTYTSQRHILRLTIYAAFKLFRHDGLLSQVRLEKLKNLLIIIMQIFERLSSYGKRVVITSLTIVPSALPFRSFIRAPISLLAPVLSTTPSSAAFALTAASISSLDICAGRRVSITASSAFSFSANSGRPPFSNCSIESLRCLAARMITVINSSSVSRASGPLPLAIASLVAAVTSPRKTESRTASLAFIASLIPALSSSCVINLCTSSIAKMLRYWNGPAFHNFDSPCARQLCFSLHALAEGNCAG